MSPPSAIQILPESDTTTFTVPDRLTIQSVAKRRAAYGKLIAGVAAPADVDSFKGRTQHLHKELAHRWNRKSCQFPESNGGAGKCGSAQCGDVVADKPTAISQID